MNDVNEMVEAECVNNRDIVDEILGLKSLGIQIKTSFPYR